MFINMFNDFLRFSEDPFKVTPDPKFFYAASSHRQALTSMIYGIETRSGLISLTGEAGTGKTALIHVLLNKIDRKAKTVCVYYSFITFEELLRNILSELEVPVEGKSNEPLLNQLNEYLAQIDKDDTVVVIIDEAQNLPEEVLEEMGRLFTLNSSASMQLQVIFVGQPEFEEKLASQRLRQINERLKIRLQIKTLNREESKEYIEHRLKLVGSSTSKIFTPEAVSMICSYAKGTPRIINILCDNALRRGNRLSRNKVDPDILREIIKNLEGPMPRKSLTTALKGICPSIPRPTLPFKKWSIAILLLLCAGGLVLVTHESRQSRSAKAWRARITLPSPLHVSPLAASPSPALEQDKIEEIVVVKGGQTISSMAEQFYRASNPTLIVFILDFNPEVTNADFITVGQTIRVPKLTEESLIMIADHAYRIHVGTFVTPDAARLYRNEPELKGKEIEVLPRKVSPKDTWYTIAIGKFNDKDEALKITGLLRKKGLLPFFSGVTKK